MSWILLIPQAVVVLLRTEVITRTASVCLFPFFEIVFNLLLSFCFPRYACVTLTGCDALMPEVAMGAEHVVALTLHGSVLCRDMVIYF